MVSFIITTRCLLLSCVFFGAGRADFACVDHVDSVIKCNEIHDVCSLSQAQTICPKYCGLCPTQITGSGPHCTALASPIHGSITPSSCLTSISSVGSRCSITCDDGFFQTSGPSSVTCTSSGQWSDIHPVVCLDVQPPSVTCPSDVTITAPTGQMSAQVTWPDPHVTDNAGASQVTLAVSLNTGTTLPEGRHTIKVTATDESGNSAACSFTVTVTAVRCPPPPVPAHGEVVRGCQNEAGSTCQVTCNPGYTLAGNDAITCIGQNAQVHWSILPTCIRDFSSRLARLESKQAKLRVDSQLIVDTLRSSHVQDSGFSVDSLAARLDQLENKTRTIETEHDQIRTDYGQRHNDTGTLQTDITSLKNDVSGLEHELNGHNTNQSRTLGSLGGRADTVDKSLSSLENSIGSLESRINSANYTLSQQNQGADRQQIGFHARLANDVDLQDGQTLIPSDISVNIGNAYNRFGEFEAKVAGQYFIAATVSSHKVSAGQDSLTAYLNASFADVRLMHDNVEVASVDSPRGGDVGSLRAVVHMRVGEKVWLQSSGKCHFSDMTTGFTGFLLQVD